MISKRVKKIFSSAKRPSRKNFWKVGLFLVFVGVMMNIGLTQQSLSSNNELKNSSCLSNSAIVKVALTLTPSANAGFFEFRENVIRKVNAYHKDIERQSDEADAWSPIKNVFVSGAKWLLWGVLQVVHWLVLASAFLFDQVIEQDLFNDVIKNNDSVYIAWAMVRDFLNLFFMLALLFSAFSTIFQVEKYHLKKIIILLVVMALLVNFSYPITLFVIDFSNSIMYFFVNLIQHSTGANSASSNSALISKMAEMGMFTKAMMEEADIPALILSIIFQFILFVTLFAFAINLLIRILAFAILLIFSPAGFTLSFFPSTSSMADSWWNSLIKYAVLGPMMIFFLLIANLMFNATGQQQFTAPTQVNDIGFVGSSLLFTIPIVFLWMGLIVSNKFGGDASSTAMGIAKSTGNWMKNKGGRMAYRGVDTVSGHRISGGIGAIKRGWDRMDDNYKSKSSARSAKYAERIGVTGAEEQNMVNQANEYKKKGLTANTLKSMASNGDASAAYLLAENKKMDGDTYTKFMEKAKNEKIRNSINGKVKQKRVDLVAISKSQDQREIDKVKKAKGWTSDDRARRHIIAQEIGSLSSEQYAQQDWSNIGGEIKGKSRATASASEKRQSAELKYAIRSAYSKTTTEGQKAISKNLNKNNAAELRKTFSLPV